MRPTIRIKIRGECECVSQWPVIRGRSRISILIISHSRLVTRVWPSLASVSMAAPAAWLARPPPAPVLPGTWGPGARTGRRLGVRRSGVQPTLSAKSLRTPSPVSVSPATLVTPVSPWTCAATPRVRTAASAPATWPPSPAPAPRVTRQGSIFFYKVA